MSTAVAIKPSWTPEQIKLITDVVARGATPDELKLFLYRCENMGLDPLKPGQIYFIKYGTGPGSIVVGIEGFRAKAAKTGKLAGIKRGVIKDDHGKLLGAWAEIRRKDWTDVAREEVSMSEFDKKKGNWGVMPEQMIKKCAEAAALRMAFPDELGGVYAPEEEGAIEASASVRIVPEQPEEGDGDPDQLEEWKFKVGMFAKRSLDETARVFGLEKMREWVAKVEARMDKARSEKKVIEKEADWIEAVRVTSDYLGKIENGEQVSDSLEG